MWSKLICLRKQFCLKGFQYNSLLLKYKIKVNYIDSFPHLKTEDILLVGTIIFDGAFLTILA